jgi:hypothetical protein
VLISPTNVWRLTRTSQTKYAAEGMVSLPFAAILTTT